MTGHGAFKRILAPPTRSFFLFGPRSVGKSFWLKTHFGKEVPYFDLLENRSFLELSRDPTLLEAKIGDRPSGSWVIIDEIQRLPSLLTEVHRLIEKKRFQFAMTGSSARKLKRGGADLLAGRALTKRMEGLSFAEIGGTYPLSQAIEWGTLPLVMKDQAHAADTLSAYVHTYVREEIREEGIVRRTEPFIRFLEVAAILNGQQLNKENIAREAMVPRSTVDVYFSILEDTLLGHFLPAYRTATKIREQTHPKFYWFDPGVARAAANLLYDPVDSDWKGRTLETLIYHELRIYNETQGKHRPITYYRTNGGSEIDFVIETQKKGPSRKSTVVCLEIKYAKKWNRHWEKPMLAFAANKKITVEKMFGIYCGEESLHFPSIQILPVFRFLDDLFRGRIF